MYNLLMTANEDAWKGDPYDFPRSRVFEYTSDALKSRYQNLESDELKELLSLPTLFTYEKTVPGDTRIGWVTNILKRTNTIQVSYKFEPKIPVISRKELAHLEWELDIGNFERNRTHWAIKEVDLFNVLFEAGIATESQIRSLAQGQSADTATAQPSTPIPIQPTVFRIPKTNLEPDLVSVMMPFQPTFFSVFEQIRDICKDLGLRCLNANEVWNEDEIIQDIFSLIYRSKIVICDFTKRNPNVFYEAGIAHTLGRPVIPIVQNSDDVPFDLRHHRHIEYKNNNEGLEDLKAQIAPRLKFLAER